MTEVEKAIERARLSEHGYNVSSESQLEADCIVLANEVKRSEKESLGLHKAGCDESERADELQAISDNYAAEVKRLQEEIERLVEGVLAKVDWLQAIVDNCAAELAKGK